MFFKNANKRNDFFYWLTFMIGLSGDIYIIFHLILFIFHGNENIVIHINLLLGPPKVFFFPFVMGIFD
jgi:hypothetical protein